MRGSLSGFHLLFSQKTLSWLLDRVGFSEHLYNSDSDELSSNVNMVIRAVLNSFFL